MSRQFIPKLCNDLIELLEEDTNYFDVIIEVGEEITNKKMFQAHSVILHYRSPYFRKVLANSTRNGENEYVLRLPNISGNIFQILLRYIYNGSLVIDSLTNLDIFRLLIAADDLYLQEFFHLSSREFFEKVRPFEKIIRQRVYEDLMQYFLVPGSDPNTEILPPRQGMIDSTLITSKHASLLSSWIDHKHQCSKLPLGFSYYEIYENPYEFKLLLRGTRDDFSLASFKGLCYDKPMTIVVMRVKGTDELVGGFNPKSWIPGENVYEYSEDSFLFAFRGSNISRGGMGVKNIILSRVEQPTHALYQSANNGLTFGGGDLEMYGEYFNEENKIYCNKYEYERCIRQAG
ncbi:9271_t:CDS:2, partial [Acaulospora morrowiae]